MLHKSLAAAALGVAAAGSSTLYVSSFSGKVTALALDGGAGAGGRGGAVPTLKTVSQTELGGAQSFLALDAGRNVLFGCDEGFRSADGNGTLFALRVERDGSLRELGRQKTQAGPVFMELFGAGKDTMVIPHL